LDAQYQKLVEIACQPYKEMDEWRELLVKAMWDAYRRVCPHETPRQMQAFAKGQGLLRIRRAEE